MRGVLMAPSLPSSARPPFSNALHVPLLLRCGCLNLDLTFQLHILTHINTHAYLYARIHNTCIHKCVYACVCMFLPWYDPSLVRPHLCFLTYSLPPLSISCQPACLSGGLGLICQATMTIVCLLVFTLFRCSLTCICTTSFQP